MVNSVESAGAVAGKRERLVAAASELFHHDGVGRTSLKDVAAASGVPLGNVYYWFRSKDDLVAAVVADRVASLEAGSAALEAASDDPGERLKGWFRQIASTAEDIARWGCPFGTLSTELAKGGRTGADGTALLAAPVAWAEQQFRAMGRDDAQALALELVMAYQGAAVLAHAFGTPQTLHAEADRVAGWIDGLERPAGRGTPTA